MKASQLIAISTSQYNSSKIEMNNPLGKNIFQKGGEWMQKWIELLEEDIEITETEKRFNFFGILKYTVCLFPVLGLFFLVNKSLLLFFILGIPLFYLLEVQLLFLFPNLIYKIEKPIWSSVKQTNKLGTIKASLIVMQIGFFMIYGLLNLKSPFHNWYIGCLSIIIWYQIEIRNRTYASFLD